MKVGRDGDHFPLRLPAGFRERLKEVAAENGRSMNSEVVVLLKRALFDTLSSADTHHSARPHASN